MPALLERKARRTTRQYLFLKEQAFALGGQPGSRLASKQGVKVSGSTLLRIIRKTPVPVHPTPRILGVDDWSYRRGVEFGTILVDLEQHCPVDLLVDRKAETLAKWLGEHPGVEIVSRDRASSYADGVRRGAPLAIQVADKFHLAKNLGDHLKNMFERKSACLLAPQVNTVSQELVAEAPVQLEDIKLEQIEFSHKIEANIEEEQPDKEEPVLSRKGYLFQSIQELAVCRREPYFGRNGTTCNSNSSKLTQTHFVYKRQLFRLLRQAARRSRWDNSAVRLAKSLAPIGYNEIMV